MPLQIMQHQMILHLDTPELKLYSDPTLQLMVVQACGFVPTDVYRYGLSLATSIAIEKQYVFWLVNNREGGIISPADQIWATEVNAPLLAKESCIRKMAFIEPKDLHSKFILEDMMNKVSGTYPFEMQFFDEVSNAHAWFLDTEVTAFGTSATSYSETAAPIAPSSPPLSGI
jgi:hypothetical protein